MNYIVIKLTVDGSLPSMIMAVNRFDFWGNKVLPNVSFDC